MLKDNSHWSSMPSHQVSSLNQEQLQAVKITEGPLVIVAGPGTGKTKTLINKINYLVEEHSVLPQQILALTFTQRAAREMRERLPEHQVQVTTFHGWCLKFLEEQEPGNSLQIVTEPQRLQLLKSLLEQEEWQELNELSLAEVSLKVSRFKNWAENEKNVSIWQKFVEAYNDALANEQLRDFDDLLLHSLTLLQQEVLEHSVQTLPRYIFVDEFQDTNEVQYQLLKLLARDVIHLAVIGDPRQSIYSFRGSSADIFARFLVDYPAAQQISLQKNYRSATQILEISQSLFPSDERLVATRDTTGEARLLKTLSRRTEADWILRDISQKLGGSDLLSAQRLRTELDEKHSGARFRDFAILYRTHRLRHAIEEKLFDSGFPFQVVGSESLYQQPAIASLIECLRWIDDDKLEPDEKLREQFRQVPKDLTGFQSLTDLIAVLRPIVDPKDTSSSLFARLLSCTHQFCSLEPKKGVVALLKYVEELAKHDYYDPQAEMITILTMHAAKGLEFEYVYLLGFEEGLVPYCKGETAAELEEERRLLYVALTRAKRGLYLLSTERAESPAKTSRFQTELIRGGLETLDDPQLNSILKKRAKSARRKQQLQLF